MLPIPSSMNTLTVGYGLFGAATLLLVFACVMPLRKSVRLLTFLVWACMSIVTLLHYVAWELTGSGFNQSIPFHLRFGMQGGEIADSSKLIVIPAVVLGLLLVGFFIFRRFFMKDHYTRHHYYVAPVLLVVLVAVHPLWSEIHETYREPVISEIPFEDHYVPLALKGGKPGAYPNLVWIYAESFERTYFDEKLFPGLTPELTKLERECLTCTDVRQLYGTGWTIAGFVSSQCGIPLVTMGVDGNELEKFEHFLPGTRGMGDLLRDKGYTTEMWMGADSSFAATGKFLRTHGIDVIDLPDILKKHPDYPSEWWGITDDLLFGLSKKRYAELQKQKKPFALFVSTIDTHHPYGRVPPAFKGRYGDGKNAALNAIYASDSFVGEFVRAIRKMDTANDTLIVVTSDHLAGPNTATKQLEAGQRRNLLMYYWPGKITPGKNSRPSSSLDKGVTALQMMGFDSTRLGLGRSLLGREKTVVEKFADPDEQLRGWETRINDFWKAPTK